MATADPTTAADPTTTDPAPTRRKPSNPIPVRVDAIPGLVERIDAARGALPVPTSRNQWMLTAFVEKLEREGR